MEFNNNRYKLVLNGLDIFPTDFLLAGSDSEEVYRTHKSLLVLSSGFFRRLFSNPADFYVDLKTNHYQFGPFSHITQHILKIVLDFLYHDKLPQIDTADDYLKINTAFKTLDIVLEAPLWRLTNVTTAALIKLVDTGYIGKSDQLDQLVINLNRFR
jgi:hypothetical protein